jgi:hypothetical protein
MTLKYRMLVPTAKVEPAGSQNGKALSVTGALLLLVEVPLLELAMIQLLPFTEYDIEPRVYVAIWKVAPPEYITLSTFQALPAGTVSTVLTNFT